jgi:hypothetical protein
MAELTVSSRNLSVDDAPKIAAAIAQLEKIGLKPLFPEREFSKLAREMAEEFEGTGIPEPPLPLTWVDLALSGSAQLFANAIHCQDHCFDGADEADYAGIVASIMALAGEAWPGATVSATKVMKQGPHGGPSARMEIAIHGQGGSAPFDLIVAKDFDWSVVTRLNERLPAGATGRFAAFFDGNAIIVYLAPDQIEALGKLFGHDFISAIEPPEERRPPQGQFAAANAEPSEPLPVWAMVIGLPIGLFAGSRLIAMMLRGAPYTILGSTPFPSPTRRSNSRSWSRHMSAALRSFLAVPLISLRGDGVRSGSHAEARLFAEPGFPDVAGRHDRAAGNSGNVRISGLAERLFLRSRLRGQRVRGARQHAFPATYDNPERCGQVSGGK